VLGQAACFRLSPWTKGMTEARREFVRRVPALRNSAPPLALGAVAACLERGARVLHWANIKTLELAFWIPGIDEMLEPGKLSPRPRSTPT
jgi:hypothetical protein